jgi:hypothetical protein
MLGVVRNGKVAHRAGAEVNKSLIMQGLVGNLKVFRIFTICLAIVLSAFKLQIWI